MTFSKGALALKKNIHWTKIRDSVRSSLDREEFQNWITPVKVHNEGDTSLVLEVPNHHFLTTIRSRYAKIVEEKARELMGDHFRVEFIERNQSTRKPTGGSDAISPNQVDSQFSPGYIFESFVVGNSNQFAHAAARAVAESPSHSYNPLFLYGGVGLGKTHLLHAVGHHIHRNHPKLKVLYLAAEQFVNELINSIRFDRMEHFRERYRTIDVLMIDDVQFIANKERTQEEFFHTFNTLYTSQKQIILSSDSSPKNIPTLEERLRSRFEWGLIADIQPPDLETKVAILRRKADARGLDLPDEVALFMASLVRSNIRELEGLLTRVAAFISFTGQPLSLELAQETLREIVPEADRKVSVGEIIKFVARHYGLKVSEIKSRSNSKQIAFPRQVAMYICKKVAHISYPEIGRQFNNKHHSTVMYSVEKIEKLRQSDPNLDRTLKKMLRRFNP